MKIETVTINIDGGAVKINKFEFDKSKHKLYETRSTKPSKKPSSK